MTLTRLALAASVAALLPAAAMAQNTLSFGIGPQSAPEYFGSDGNTSGVAATVDIEQLNLGPLRFGNGPDGPAYGIGFTGSFRYIAERNALDYPELAGTDTIDAALEVGGGVTYSAANYYVFALARYGITGHDSLVGELGADAVVRPTAQTELRFGPRLFFADDDYAQTYFGLGASETGGANDAFAAPYDAAGGLLSRGVEASASYSFSPDWALRGVVRYDEFTNDAADSPIVLQGSDSATSLSLMATRRFSF
ncbi:Outer membrane scaffolding protein for murein synthesis, MipA/OmpV family [Loktanella fryxellensis]|uniref:Outer membrane scaffolding protein for murein synthesis, MipA/OmpV family n=1 Tax=Loktanella fryxellensis TaxID=245187 RepID=A0A1H8EL56_9RHOB|nr:MipA/OmpV family protein [Loktanella fryxellensis]SEN20219.1 Outer membrane scaffolding protein for murein synthesis, MipA/OmpV family [Loktanella fryxellensis]